MSGEGAREGLLTPTRIRALLDAHGLAPRRRLGQNFVVDANTVRKMVHEAGVRRGESIVEVGPGLGSLTLALRRAGAEVTAVEIDAGLAAALRDVVDPDVRIVVGDAVRTDWADLVEPPVAMVANLPYNVATPVVMTALASGCFSRLHVMVQREVGERWCAGVGDSAYGAVSVKIAAVATARIVSPVSRAAFWPVPRVDSVTVAIEVDPKPASGEAATCDPPDEAGLFALVDAGFAQRRKRLRNALAAAGHRPESVEAALVNAGLDPGARAEQLSVTGWRRLRAHLA